MQTWFLLLAAFLLLPGCTSQPSPRLVHAIPLACNPSHATQRNTLAAVPPALQRANATATAESLLRVAGDHAMGEATSHGAGWPIIWNTTHGQLWFLDLSDEGNAGFDYLVANGSVDAAAVVAALYSKLAPAAWADTTEHAGSWTQHLAGNGWQANLTIATLQSLGREAVLRLRSPWEVPPPQALAPKTTAAWAIASHACETGKRPSDAMIDSRGSVCSSGDTLVRRHTVVAFALPSRSYDIDLLTGATLAVGQGRCAS